MFQRRKPQNITTRIREIFWPEMGWSRALKYAKLRIIRLSDSTQKIALGLAIGAVISFTPIVGTHIIQAAAICYFIRANVLASVIGTFVGNPWTFPFMWWAAMSFGTFLFQIFGLPTSAVLPEVVNLEVVWDLIKTDPFRIVLPWFIGGYLLALLCLGPAYVIFYKLVKGAKAAQRRARLRRKRKKNKENPA